MYVANEIELEELFFVCHVVSKMITILLKLVEL